MELSIAHGRSKDLNIARRYEAIWHVASGPSTTQCFSARKCKGGSVCFRASGTAAFWT